MDMYICIRIIIYIYVCVCVCVRVYVYIYFIHIIFKYISSSVYVCICTDVFTKQTIRSNTILFDRVLQTRSGICICVYMYRCVHQTKYSDQHA